MQNKKEVNENLILGPLKILTKYHKKCLVDESKASDEKQKNIVETIEKLEEKITNEVNRLT